MSAAKYLLDDCPYNENDWLENLEDGLLEDDDEE